MLEEKWLILCVLTIAVTGCAATQEATPARPELPPPPTRSAIEDSDLRALLRDIASAQLCRAIESSFSGLPDSDATEGVEGGMSPSSGRLWIRECEVAVAGDQVIVDIGGPGWVWLNRGASGFEVRDYLRLSAQMRLTGELDVGYDREKHVVSLWFTPRQRVVAKVSPIGEVPVRPESVLAKMASVLSAVRDRAQEQAQEAVVEDGSILFQDALQSGFTVTANLCTGQLDSMVGALSDGEIPRRPYPPDGHRWLANERARIRHGGLDVAGPWQSGTAALQIDVEVEEGSGAGAEVRVVCAEDAEQLVDAFLHQRDEPTLTARAYATIAVGATTRLEVDAADCPVTLITRPHGEGEEPVVIRFRVIEVGADMDALVDCAPASMATPPPVAPSTPTPVITRE